jgi:small subunit ribosomal protein S17
MVKNLVITDKVKFLQGEVISTAMDKTVTVKVSRSRKHPKLLKIVQDFKKYKVHDENNEAVVGDLIEFYQGRPKSKTKYMYLHRVLPKV